MTKYHWLLLQDNGEWFAEFGAYDRDDVQAEYDDMRDHGVPHKRLKIVTLNELHDITEYVARLNREANGSYYVE
jgi:hypothetical protein